MLALFWGLCLAQVVDADPTFLGSLSSAIFGSQKCSNTAQGPHLITDSEGAVCHIEHVAPDGCCEKQLALKSCDSCNTDSLCCTQYEYCVSCCMNQEGFDECSERCRTSSKSTRHGNEYKSTKQHCYDKERGQFSLAKVMLKEEDTVILVLKQSLVSCTEACQRHSSSTGDTSEYWEGVPSEKEAEFICSEEILQSVNTCDALKKHFSCANSACSKKTKDGPSFDLSSGACQLADKLSCHTRSKDSHRLCKCVRATAI